MSYKIIMVLLMFLSMIHLQELGEWRWADDTSEFKMDKRAHLGISTGLYFMFRHKDYTEVESIFYTFCLGLGKEIVDATVPWENMEHGVVMDFLNMIYIMI